MTDPTDDAAPTTAVRAPALTGLEGRVALVTGAGDNIGRAVALALAGAGVNVAVNVKENLARGDEVTAAAAHLGVEAVTVVGDVADRDRVDAMVATVQERLGPVDILVHCVGARLLKWIVKTPLDDWRRILETNCTSYFSLAQLLLPSMTERGFGRIIAFGGPDATRPQVRRASVAASKAAMVALTKAIALEAGPKGVTANVVSPAITETLALEYRDPEQLGKLVAIPRAARLDEIASACLFLASEQGAYITGQTLRVDGGFEM